MQRNEMSQIVQQINEQQKKVNVQTRKVLALLQEENTCVVRLRSVYESLKKEVARKQQLVQQKREMEAAKSNLMSLSAENNPSNFKRLTEVKEQCARKQMELKSIKQEFVGNAVTLNSVSKESQLLKLELLSKQEQYSKLKLLNTEKRKAINQTQTEIQGETALFKEQKMKTLKLKQQLAQICLLPTKQASTASIKQEIMKQQQISCKMRRMMSEICDL